MLIGSETNITGAPQYITCGVGKPEPVPQQWESHKCPEWVFALQLAIGILGSPPSSESMELLYLCT